MPGAYRFGVGTSGDDGGRMTVEKLAEFIGEYIKHKGVKLSATITRNTSKL